MVEYGSGMTSSLRKIIAEWPHKWDKIGIHGNPYIILYTDNNGIDKVQLKYSGLGTKKAWYNMLEEGGFISPVKMTSKIFSINYQFIYFVFIVGMYLYKATLTMFLHVRPSQIFSRMETQFKYLFRYMITRKLILSSISWTYIYAYVKDWGSRAEETI